MPYGESRLKVCFFFPILGFSVVFFHHLVLVDSSPKWPTFWKFQSFFWYGFSEYRWLRVLKPSMRCSHQWVIIKVGLGISRTRILIGIQFTTYFIDFFVQFVGSTVNVLLTRQTCGQRSSGAAESKRRAIGNYFSERICYMFLISKCRGDWGLGLCTTSVLAFGQPQHNGNIRFFLCQKTFFFRILPLRCGFPKEKKEVWKRPRSWSPLHFDIGNI